MTFASGRVKAYLAKPLVILRELHKTAPDTGKILASNPICAYLNGQENRLAVAAARNGAKIDDDRQQSDTR